VIEPVTAELNLKNPLPGSAAVVVVENVYGNPALVPAVPRIP
jgi:hypothetical protein